MADLETDPRVDPRIKQLMGAMPPQPQANVASRQEYLARANSPDAQARMAGMREMFEMVDNDQVASSEGLSITEHTFISDPDGNSIKVQFIRPEQDGPLPCVYYIHGGGMQSMSCFWGLYRAWGKLIANQGVAVAMVDFRNCATPSSAPEVAPYPAGLNDCVSGIRWLHEHAGQLGIDPQHIVIAGESAACMRCARTSPAPGRRSGIPHPLKTTGCCWTCTIIAAPWPTAWRHSRPAIRWHGRPLPPRTMCAGCRRW